MRNAAAVLRLTRSSTLPRAVPPLVRPALAVPPLHCTSSRGFASSSLLLKKAKPSPSPKPVKGKARAAEPSDESTVDLADVLDKTKGKMVKAVEWAKGVLYDGVERGRGRVSPALLDGVKVTLPDTPGLTPLNAVASVTVKSNSLFIEVWDTDATKHVESALHQANLPGLSPQRIDGNTLKIPVSRPTVEQRSQILKNLHTTVEAAKQQVRTARSEGMKHLGGRGEEGSDEVQKLADEYGGELDGVMIKAKKEFEKA